MAVALIRLAAVWFAVLLVNRHSRWVVTLPVEWPAARAARLVVVRSAAWAGLVVVRPTARAATRPAQLATEVVLQLIESWAAATLPITSAPIPGQPTKLVPIAQLIAQAAGQPAAQAAIGQSVARAATGQPAV